MKAYDLNHRLFCIRSIRIAGKSLVQLSFGDGAICGLKIARCNMGKYPERAGADSAKRAKSIHGQYCAMECGYVAVYGF
jgi:hypothetical protein